LDGKPRNPYPGGICAACFGIDPGTERHPCGLSMANEETHLPLVSYIAGTRMGNDGKPGIREKGEIDNAAKYYRRGSQKNESTSFLR